MDERKSTKYERLLKEAGFEVLSVYDDTIFFKLISYGYSLDLDPGSPEYLSFNLGAAIDDGKNKDRAARYELLQFINAGYKYVKCSFGESHSGAETIQFSCDLMFISDSDFKKCAHTIVGTLDNAYISVSAKFPDLV
ncbi:hypothetical protein HU750_08535 [Pseudomonas sp. SWRI50]|uniref:hypothetical protein n=1 Tax=Pseudomonas sp. SWRI50 TaxID=2745484 RepID=UPI001647996B|nr:hypothetical protein [Pseudomonas sp. SWRI50]MBC3485717.1 hypothetical protein [Pseudomonas sp. SWRI50]